ncbi:glycosyltransferase [Niveispirillum cyanobacteriorum]|uniref:Spore protein YkvP/CgeB glycosyl transferase-like domain-containing protein n=1 Tax=Niveispirillum cyanobacteriorum TaxID=1612173 RepID=A0A2K9NLH6_9PROT|nr:glycosyltransferase [Niveispirillum cyanobacteriorum]AUN33920.1 hypothetical protein C0V82_26280 [Niveispirillum cyanobacteriorum]GGE86036.1 hypothetical protein GCM10011317_49000 [Niveispirillum cyanobacteriorum]
MRVALHNPFPPALSWAEHELAKRFEMACANLGWTARTCHLSTEIDDVDPDIVLGLHPQSAPKLTRHPSAGCLWNPPSLYNDAYWPRRHELSHDIHLHASQTTLSLITDLLYPTIKPLITAPIYPSAPHIALTPTVDIGSRLFYIGSNWDGKRYPEVLRRLATAGVLALHGSPDRWQHLEGALCGPVPFDGVSVISRANACGLGLCLHLPAHTDSAIPNMRIFELCAAGVLPICGDHRFIREKFGETVLYIDTSRPEEEMADAIIRHVMWARAHPTQAKRMATAAQNIFLEDLTLEKLLAPLPDLLSDLRRANSSPVPVTPDISIVVPWNENGEEGVARRLRMLAQQARRSLMVVIAVPQEATQAANAVWEQHEAAFQAGTVVTVPEGSCASTLLWTGLKAIDAPWAALLPGDITLYPDHFECLLAAAARAGADAVYAGVLGPVPSGQRNPGCAHPEEPLSLDWFDPFGVPDARESTSRIHPGAVLVRHESLRPLLAKDPLLPQGADSFLLRRLADRLPFVPSWQVSAQAHRNQADRAATDTYRLTALEALAPVPVAGSNPQGWASAGGGKRLHWPPPADGLPIMAGPLDFAALPDDRPVLVYGASRGGRLVQLELAKWEALNCTGFLDSFQDGMAFGWPIRRIDAVPRTEIEGASVIIASVYVTDILAKLQAAGALHVYNAYPYIAAHTP